jgi:hypothetical protein
MIEPKTHTIEQPGAPREEVSSQPAADEELPSSGPTLYVANQGVTMKLRFGGKAVPT